MGTNYYAITGAKVDVVCDCGFTHTLDERLHIGKNSWGWMFSLHIIQEKGIFELEDWLPILKTSRIVDEYGDEVSYDEMISIILKKDGRGKGNALNKAGKQKLLDNAKLEGYNVDTKSWLLYSSSRGKDGNYTLNSGEYC